MFSIVLTKWLLRLQRLFCGLEDRRPHWSNLGYQISAFETAMAAANSVVLGLSSNPTYPR
jgi:hypothetical protein